MWDIYGHCEDASLPRHFLIVLIIAERSIARQERRGGTSRQRERPRINLGMQKSYKVDMERNQDVPDGGEVTPHDGTYVSINGLI